MSWVGSRKVGRNRNASMGFLELLGKLLVWAVISIAIAIALSPSGTDAFGSKTAIHSRSSIPNRHYDLPHENVLRWGNSFHFSPSPSTRLGSSKPSLAISVDPLVARLFQQEEEDDDDGDEDTAHKLQGLRGIGSGILESSRGLMVWRRALAKGRSPVESDFDVEFDVDSADDALVWPPQPLFSSLQTATSSLQLGRLALRHPETTNMILRSILRTTLEYATRKFDAANEDSTSQLLDEEDDEEEEEDNYDPYFYDFEEGEEDEIDISFELPAGDDQIAREVAESLVEEWTEVVQGVSLLDDIFGFDHDLLSSGQDEGENDGDDDGGTAGAAMGFGIRDGIWSHTGWRAIPALQQQIASIPELKELMQELGRRPSAEHEAGNPRKLERFAPRRRHPEGALGAEFDPFLRKESVTGIGLSGQLAEMLPSEAVLLRQKLGERDDDDEGKPSSTVLRRLFLAKLAESKLQSYELSGWADVPSIPRTNPLYRNRLPSAPGGPIMVCLDTSWSMSGNREALSKAVVLACVSEAHKQGRDCQVVSFSTERKVMETGVITADSHGIQRLLEFLSHSFGGGTDVTGALKFAIASLEGNGNEESALHPQRSKDFAMEAADILLVTDGEIPDPPVPPPVMESIERLKFLKGVKIHGLLVGKSESKPLSRLCTHIHDFLSRYTLPTAISAGGSTASTTSFNSIRQTGRLSATKLYARRSYYDDNDEGDGYSRKGRKRKKGNRKWDRYEEEDDDETDFWTDPVNEMVEDDAGEVLVTAGAPDEAKDSTSLDTAKDELLLLKQAAADAIAQNSWTAEKLNEERKENEECWETHKHLNAAIARVEDGLVERGEDARLVVLAMIANEHILLLGKPGTGKSVLGLRLANLCDGTFFQRLLTRFTTPEELFGPLSLKALENDEYRRVTSGFLPTADIAFLDEIFKANSAILNTLLTILNERKFDNGGSREPCPMRCVVGASNELPDSDELVALYDRFLIRKEVVPVTDEGVTALLSMSNPGESSCEINGNESCDIPLVGDLDGIIIESLASASDTILMDKDACELMRDMRAFLRENHDIEISDRRLVKAARLLKISAASDGRKKVDTLDFLLLQHCFWNEPGQRVAIREWLWDNLTPSDRGTDVSPNQMRFLLDNLRREILTTLRKTNGSIDGTVGAKSADIATLDVLREESQRIATIAVQRLDALARHMELVKRSADFTWIEPDDARTIQQLLLPRAELLWPQMKKVAEDATALRIAISPEHSLALSNENRGDLIELLWEDGSTSERAFTEDELQITMREAKSKYDLETFRRWKRAKKKLEKASN